MASASAGSSGGSGGGGTNKWSIIGGAITAVGQLWEGYWNHRMYDQQAKQLKYDTQTQWDYLQRSAQNEEKDRIYNANLERAMNALSRGEFNASLARSGVRGQSVMLLQKTQASAMETDVQERSRQSRNKIKDTKWEAEVLLRKSRYQQKLLKMQGNVALMNGIVNAAGTVMDVVGGIQTNKSSDYSGGGSGGSSASGGQVASKVSSSGAKGK